jgi:hypothetical protein
VSARIFAENLGLEDLQIAQPIWFNSLQVASFHPLDPASNASCRLDILSVDDASRQKKEAHAQRNDQGITGTMLL